MKPKQLQGRWYYSEGRFYHRHSADSFDYSRRGIRFDPVHSYVPVMDLPQHGPACMECKGHLPVNVKMLFNLQKLKGKV